jgi:hypothetical protein
MQQWQGRRDTYRYSLNAPRTRQVGPSDHSARVLIIWAIKPRGTSAARPFAVQLGALPNRRSLATDQSLLGSR